MLDVGNTICPAELVSKRPSYKIEAGVKCDDVRTRTTGKGSCRACWETCGILGDPRHIMPVRIVQGS